MRNVDVGAEDIDGLLALAQAENVGLTIVGPEAPLVAGIVDRFTEAGLPCFGPSAAAAIPRAVAIDPSIPLAPRLAMTRAGPRRPPYESISRTGIDDPANNRAPGGRFSMTVLATAGSSRSRRVRLKSSRSPG